jgi:hypothetical protein
MIFVCILGPYTAKDVLSVAENCRRGHEMAIELLRLGFAVHDPWLDLHWALIADLPLSVFKENTIEHLKRSDVAILTRGWRESKGVTIELEIAADHNVPVFDNIEQLEEWRKLHEKRGNALRYLP